MHCKPQVPSSPEILSAAPQSALPRRTSERYHPGGSRPALPPACAAAPRAQAAPPHRSSADTLSHNGLTASSLMLEGLPEEGASTSDLPRFIPPPAVASAYSRAAGWAAGGAAGLLAGCWA